MSTRSGRNFKLAPEPTVIMPTDNSSSDSSAQSQHNGQPDTETQASINDLVKLMAAQQTQITQLLQQQHQLLQQQQTTPVISEQDNSQRDGTSNKPYGLFMSFKPRDIPKWPAGPLKEDSNYSHFLTFEQWATTTVSTYVIKDTVVAKKIWERSVEIEPDLEKFLEALIYRNVHAHLHSTLSQSEYKSFYLALQNHRQFSRKGDLGVLRSMQNFKNYDLTLKYDQLCLGQRLCFNNILSQLGVQLTPSQREKASKSINTMVAASIDEDYRSIL